MRCWNWDVDKFVEDFNAKVMQLPQPLDAGTERLCKATFLSGIPFHVKEYLYHMERYPSMTLNEVQVEAKRQMSISALLNKGKDRGKWNDNAGGNKDAKYGTSNADQPKGQ